MTTTRPTQRVGANRTQWTLRCTAAVAATLITVSGCSTPVDGAAVRAAGGPPPGAVDVSLLDPGNYPTKPRAPLGVAGTPNTGGLLDAQRMADFVVGPWEVDPTLITALPFGQSPGSMPLKPGVGPAGGFTPKMSAAAMRHNYVYGFATARQAVGQRQLFNTVLRMADPASASAAATDLAATVGDQPTDIPPVVMTPTPIPGHDETVAVASQFTEYQTTNTWKVIDAFTAHGPYVLVQHAQVIDAPDAGDAVAQLVSKAVDLQAPLIDQFTPTDPAQFANVPRDPSGLLARSLPVAPGAGTVINNATFGQHGALMFQADPAAAAKDFTDHGVDTAISSADWVYQTRDPAAAAAYAAPPQPLVGTPADPVPNLPGSHCEQSTDPNNRSFDCTAAVGRYVFNVWSNQLNDAHQKAAAQYAMLAAQ